MNDDAAAWPEEEPDQRTIGELNSNRSTYRLVARIGFILTPAMFFLPLIAPLFGSAYQSWGLICMTASFAVLVSASSFSVMANTPAGKSPGVHQLWAVPLAIIVMFPGGIFAFFLYAMIVSLLAQTP
ncbi:hypothetical protein ACWGJ9_08220 [Curtobacterium citreum]